MKNSPIEKSIFEEFLGTKGLPSSDLEYSGHSYVRFKVDQKKVSVLLSEITYEGKREEGSRENGILSDRPAHKIRSVLTRHLKNEFKDQKGEVWLFLFTHQAPLSGFGQLEKELPEIEQLVVDFLMNKRDVDKIIIFEKGQKEAALEVSRG